MQLAENGWPGFKPRNPWSVRCHSANFSTATAYWLQMTCYKQKCFQQVQRLPRSKLSLHFPSFATLITLATFEMRLSYWKHFQRWQSFVTVLETHL